MVAKRGMRVEHTITLLSSCTFDTPNQRNGGIEFYSNGPSKDHIALEDKHIVLTRAQAQSAAPSFMVVILNELCTRMQTSETQVSHLKQHCHNVTTKAHNLELQLNNVVTKAHNLEHQLKKEREEHQVCDLTVEELASENQRLTSQNQQLRDEVQRQTSQIPALVNFRADEPQIPKHRIVFEALYMSRLIDTLQSALRETTDDGRLKCLDGEMDRLFMRLVDLESQLVAKTEQLSAKDEQIVATNKQLEIYKDLGGHVLESDERPVQTNSA